MIARKSYISISNTGILSIFGYISLYFIAHFMGARALGIIGFALSVVGLFSFMFDMGFSNAHIKRIAEGKNLGTCIGTFITAKLLFSMIAFSFVILGIQIWKNVLHKGFESDVHELVIYIILINFIVINLYEIFIITFKAKIETTKQIIPSIISVAIQTIAIIIVALMTKNVLHLALTYVLGSLIAFMISSYMMRNYPISRPNMEYFKSYYDFALPTIISSTFSTILMNMDKIMIQFFVGSIGVGYYFAAQKITNAIKNISMSVIGIYFPQVSKLLHENNLKEVQKLTRSTERYLSLFITPFVIFILIFNKNFIFLFLGDDFHPSTSIFVILLIASLIALYSRPSIHQAFSINPYINAKFNIFSSISNVILNITFIPKEFLGIKLLGLGAFGAALSTLILWILNSFYHRVMIYRITGTRPYWGIFKHIFSSFAVSIILFQLSNSIVIGWIIFIALLISNIILYFIVLYVLREFTHDDLKLIFDTVNPKKMKQYMKNELKN